MGKIKFKFPFFLSWIGGDVSSYQNLKLQVKKITSLSSVRRTTECQDIHRHNLLQKKKIDISICSLWFSFAIVAYYKKNDFVVHNFKYTGTYLPNLISLCTTVCLEQTNKQTYLYYSKYIVQFSLLK